jgi:hypothetical protein
VNVTVKQILTTIPESQRHFFLGQYTWFCFFGWKRTIAARRLELLQMEQRLWVQV